MDAPTGDRRPPSRSVRGTERGLDVADLADALSLAVRAVPGVSHLNAGALEEIGTYLPGRRVAGVRVPHDGGVPTGPVEVHVVVAPGFAVPRTAREVHDVVARELAGRAVRTPVLVHVDDVGGGRQAGPGAPTRAWRDGVW
ncbi:hypothetical protein AB1207_14550 [Kineococcus endophyticus]|uniref:Asp23/Gls24 family envelope stress response protein n=1 Tax=Kineococcus endophyticus TaxID=1181883 RepID=A0ABV3P8L3_9ACTN